MGNGGHIGDKWWGTGLPRLCYDHGFRSSNAATFEQSGTRCCVGWYGIGRAIVDLC